MFTDSLNLPASLPEWRRSGRFFLIALGLHGMALAYPLHQALHREAEALPVMQVQLGSAKSVPTPLPLSAAPPPQKQTARPQATPRKTVMQVAKSPTQTATPPLVPSPVPVENTLPTAAVTTTAPLASAPIKAAPTAGNAPLSPVRFDVAYLQNPAPAYPAISRRLGEEGRVLLRVKVSAEGAPLAVNLEKSSNFARLDDSAIQVVNRWRFVPAKRGDEAIEASVIVPIVFRLEG